MREAGVLFGAGIAMAAGEVIGAANRLKDGRQEGCEFIRPVFVTMVILTTLKLLYNRFFCRCEAAEGGRSNLPTLRFSPRLGIFFWRIDRVFLNSGLERMTIQDIMPQTSRARELLGDFWFNSGPVPLAALRGQVVLLYFWDYSCAGCLRMLPYVTEWERRYQPFGLVTVGVHSPRFTFGKKPEHVQKAVARHGIGFPVVMDNEGLIALQYECRLLPETILVDKDGFIRYRSTGDGNAAAVEHALQALLYSAGVGAELPMIMDPLREADRSGAICFRATPELFAGYLRGTIGNVEGYAPESVLSYADPGMYLDGRLYADGEWRSERECLRLTGEPAREGSRACRLPGARRPGGS